MLVLSVLGLFCNDVAIGAIFLLQPLGLVLLAPEPLVIVALHLEELSEVHLAVDLAFQGSISPSPAQESITMDNLVMVWKCEPREVVYLTILPPKQKQQQQKKNKVKKL